MSDPYSTGAALPDDEEILSAPVTAQPSAQETRHYIGVAGTGMRVSAAVEGVFLSPAKPVSMADLVGLDALADQTEGRLLYPVDAATAREWNADDELGDLTADLLDAVDRAVAGPGCPTEVLDAARALRARIASEPG